MTSETLLNIAKGFDNVKFIKTPVFMHNWIDGEHMLRTSSCSLKQERFKFCDFIDYLENELCNGNTVYILEDSNKTTYDANTFEPWINLNLKSIFGIVKKPIKINEELIVTSDFDKFKYLLIR